MDDRVGQEGVEPALYEGGEGDSEQHAELRSHLESYFEREGRELTWPGAAASRAMPAFRVLEIPPNRETALWTYASIGAFAGAGADDPPVEFILMMAKQTGRGVELMSMVAHYHHLHPLALGHTLPIGEALLPGASCDAFLVSLPHPFGPSLARAPVGVREVRVYWLLPITPPERRFVKTHGVEALEAEFERAPLQYWVPDRRSVVG
jgi:hypothetical protein